MTGAAAAGTPVIRTEALTKRFGRVLAVDGVSLEVAEGDRYGFLGPNGSGKTTTVRILLGLVFATCGSVEVLGRRVPRHARALAHRRGRPDRGTGGLRPPVRPARTSR